MFCAPLREVAGEVNPTISNQILIFMMVCPNKSDILLLQPFHGLLREGVTEGKDLADGFFVY